MAKGVVLEFLPPPGEAARTCGPGPFSMANQEMVTGMMKSAGYENINFERVDAPVLVGRTIRDAVDFQLALGPAGEVFREAGDAAEEKREAIEVALAEAIDAQKKEADGIVMDSSSWVISATNPGSTPRRSTPFHEFSRRAGRARSAGHGAPIGLGPQRSRRAAGPHRSPGSLDRLASVALRLWCTAPRREPRLAGGQGRPVK